MAKRAKLNSSLHLQQPTPSIMPTCMRRWPVTQPALAYTPGLSNAQNDIYNRCSYLHVGVTSSIQHDTKLNTDLGKA